MLIRILSIVLLVLSAAPLHAEPKPSTNNPPVANAGEDITGRQGSSITLNGSASHDPDGDNFSYRWSQLTGDKVELKSANSPTPYFDVPPIKPGGGIFIFKLEVTDDNKDDPKTSTPDTVIVHVASDIDPPNCKRALPSKVSLRPLDSKMHAIKIKNVVDDRDFYNIAILDIVKVTQDEPVLGEGYGSNGPDAVIQVADPVDSVLLRAEAGKDGNGRVYRIDFTATDGFEKCEGSVMVSVPNGQNKNYAVDDGQNYDSTKPGEAPSLTLDP
ncbi:MAG: hypothetical protein G3M78_02540 [Candidatus Nitrohelix vancouverensis]|uniref:PKD/Chitinase domain-containing protein n=1 Tax=Candidatus Nitrohelix vancouverensis TaxID=2705534 RepID=A0A7T0C0K6_9BACT|nr:MAG: hypothetical protein G3M78_02540 [Candidatus Nitrohelix vancouverensis]